MKKFIALLLVLAMALPLLAGCRGTPLPDGMDEETLLAAGEEVAERIIAGEYDRVRELLREDIRAGVTAQAIEALFAETLSEAGTLRELDDDRVQGSRSGEPHGIAELYYKFTKKTVRFRIAFDLDMNLIGIDSPVKI